MNNIPRTAREVATELDLMSRDATFGPREHIILNMAARWMFIQLDLNDVIIAAKGDGAKLQEGLQAYCRRHGIDYHDHPPAPSKTAREPITWRKIRDFLSFR